MKEIFQLVVAFLQHHYTEHFAKLLLSILSWDFAPKIKSKRATMINKESEFITFKPPQSWRDLLLNNDMLACIFKTCKNHPNHTTFQVLQQLSSCQGVGIFGSTKVKTDSGNQIDVRQEFVNICLFLLVDNFPSDLKVLSQNLSSTELGQFSYGLSSVISNLISLNANFVLKSLHFQDKFLPWLVEISENISILAAKDALNDYDIRSENKFEDAFTHIAKSWLNLCLDDKISPIPNQVYNRMGMVLIQSFLTSPEGFRSLLSEAEEVEEEIDVENDENSDKIIFDIHFSAIARLIRMMIWRGDFTIIKNLIQLLNVKSEQLVAICSDNLAVPHNLNPTDLYEDLHFLILILGYILADDCSGESSRIPLEFEKIKKNNESVAFFELIQVFFKFINFVTETSQNNLKKEKSQLAFSNSVISPIIIEDLCWFLARFGETYWLFWEEGSNQKTSVDIKQEFSMERNSKNIDQFDAQNNQVVNLNTQSEYIQFITNSCFQIFQVAILSYSSEETLCVQAAQMITNLTKSRPYRTNLLEPLIREITASFNKSIGSVVQILLATGNVASANLLSQHAHQIWTMQLSPKSSRAITKSLIQISFTDINTSNIYWNKDNPNKIFKELEIFLREVPNNLLNCSLDILNDCLYKYSMIDIVIGCVETFAPDNSNTIFDLITGGSQI